MLVGRPVPFTLKTYHALREFRGQYRVHFKLRCAMWAPRVCIGSGSVTYFGVHNMFVKECQ